MIDKLDEFLTRFGAPIFAAVAISCAIGGTLYDAKHETDRNARRTAMNEKCSSAVAKDLPLSQVNAACARDEVLRHYEDVGMLLYAGFACAGMAAVGLFAVRNRSQ